MDFGKFKYEQEKKDRENKQKSKNLESKEIRLSAKIGEHDLQIKANKARELAEKGHKIQVSLRMRGRENIFANRAIETIRKFADIVEMDLQDEPKKLGNQIRVSLIPRKEQKDAKIKNSQSEHQEI